MKVNISSLEPEKVDEEIITLYTRWWNSEYPVIIDRNTVKGVQRTFMKNTEHWDLLVAKKKSTNESVGLLVLQHEFLNDRKNWFTIVIDRKYQRKGIGSKLIEKAKQLVDQLHGWVIPFNDYKKEDGSYYKSPINFYLKLGFKIGDDYYVEKKDLHLVEVYWEPE
ncbi:MAG: GNAT family N-acetyltransferase [Candidatus Hodarchaeales archaeon]